MAKTGIELGDQAHTGRAAYAGTFHSHPSLEDLEAYHRRSLDAESRELILDHLAECQDCTILLLYGIIEPEDNGQEPNLPGGRLDEAWGRLRPRLSLIHGHDRTLARVMSDNCPLPLHRAIDLAAAIARALARLHMRGRLISDLRPENILVDSAGEVRVLDVGLAPLVETFEVGYGRTSEGGYGRTSEDALVDLFRLLSPEQVVRDALTARSNLFSLGVLLYEMLTGISPFRDSTPLATASRILSLDPVPVRTLNPEVDDSLAKLIHQLMAKDPERRPRDADRVARELGWLVEGTMPQTSAETEAGAADLEIEIDQLYEQIIQLSEESAMDGSVVDEEIEAAFTRLLELQTAEANSFRQRFEASLEMPLDAGEQILARAQRLRDELEDLTSRDTAPRSSDTP